MTDTGGTFGTYVLCENCIRVFYPNGMAITQSSPNGLCICPRCKKEWMEFPAVTSTFPPPSITICPLPVHRDQDELGYLFCHWCGRRLSE